MTTVRINLTRIEESCADVDIDMLADIFPDWNGDLTTLARHLSREPDFAGVLEGTFPMFAATANFVEDQVEVIA